MRRYDCWKARLWVSSLQVQYNSIRIVSQFEEQRTSSFIGSENADKKFTNAALIDRTPSQELSSNDTLLENSFDIEYFYPTYLGQPKKTVRIFTIHRDSVARDIDENESDVTPSHNITLPRQEFNPSKQLIETAEHLNSYLSLSENL